MLFYPGQRKAAKCVYVHESFAAAPARSYSIGRLAGLFVASTAVVYFSLRFSAEAERVAAIWPLNTLVLALLARQARSGWLVILATVLFANWMTTCPRPPG